MVVSATLKMGVRALVHSSLTLLLILAFWTTAIFFPLPLTGATSSSENSKKESERPGLEFAPGQILVRFRSQQIARREERAAQPLRGNRGREIPVDVVGFDGADLVEGLRMARVPAEDTLEAIGALQNRSDVVYAEPNYVVRTASVPNDQRYSEMFALNNTGQSGGIIGADIGAEKAWDITTGSSNVVVGIIDTGIDINHPDLQANIWTNPGESGDGKETNNLDDDGNGRIDDVNGWDFYNNDKTVFDNAEIDRHGTHVAGTIGAAGNNGIGIAGVSWQVKMMPLKFLGSPQGSGNVTGAISAIKYVKAMRDRGVNIRVLNNSWGGGGYSQSLLDGINEANNAGILFVVAAGNRASDNDGISSYPANYEVPNVISVAATDRADGLASFSSFGIQTVHVAAPGRAILSTTPNDTYSLLSGTSMATPHVTGVASLILAAYPDISLGHLRNLLLFNGDYASALAGKTMTGLRLSARGALQAAAETDTTPPGPIGDLRVAAQQERNIALSWTAPGDDGVTGRATFYKLIYTDQGTNQKIALAAPLPLPSGALQTATLKIPYRRPAGKIELQAFDNLGNSNSLATVAVAVNPDVVDPYNVTRSAPIPLSTGGAALGLRDDDVFRRDYTLPFAFPFFGQERQSVTISTNGVLYFSPPPAHDAVSSVRGLNAFAMIAGLWDDIRTDRRQGDDIYIVTPNSETIIFRWQGVTFDSQIAGGTTRGELPVSFEIELRRDGTITMRYGDGNNRLAPVVGVSAGEPEAYVVDSHTLEANFVKNLGSAETVSFELRQKPLPNNAPQVKMMRPENFVSFPVGSLVTLEATASDADGSVAKVEFFSGSLKLGEASGTGITGGGVQTYTLSINTGNARPGTYPVHAVAIDNRGTATASSPLLITLSEAANKLPIVVMTAPLTNSLFPVGAMVTLEARASDADGTIAKVAFYSGTFKIGEDTSPPYSFQVNTANVAPDTYSIYAVATDNGGATARSPQIAITITSP